MTPFSIYLLGHFINFRRKFRYSTNGLSSSTATFVPSPLVRCGHTRVWPDIPHTSPRSLCHIFYTTELCATQCRTQQIQPYAIYVDSFGRSKRLSLGPTKRVYTNHVETFLTCLLLFSRHRSTLFATS